jgi:hypothetical protein
VKKMKKFLALFTLFVYILFSTTTVFAAYLVSDPQEAATYYVITLLNDLADPDDDQDFEVSAMADGSLHADLVNFPAGLNQLEVRAGNVHALSDPAPFEFVKDMPGLPTHIKLVNIDGLVYVKTDPQTGIYSYRVIIDGVEFIVDAEPDGSLLYELDLTLGVHSIEAYAINMWGESNPVPFNFTKTLTNAPENLRLQQN